MKVTKGPYEYNYFDGDDRTMVIKTSRIPEGWKSILRQRTNVGRLVGLTVASAFLAILISAAVAVSTR